MSYYPWQRFWCSRGGQLQLDSAGYLIDPNSPYYEYYPHKAISFEKMDEEPCLVLLGEPGQGKSAAIKDAINLLPTSSKRIILDLKGESDFARVIRKLFECDQFRDWQRTEEDLYIFIDSLDECAIRLNNLSKLLADEVEERLSLPESSKRLKLRLACRTAEWQTGFRSLEETLKRLWASDQPSLQPSPGIYELAPLRKIDIQLALQTEGIDADKGIEQIALRRAEPLASKPVTLLLLIKLLKRNFGELAGTQVELYEQGCLELTKELDSDRTFGRSPRTSPEQRLAVASRIAAMSIFGRKRFISLELAYEDLPDGLYLSNLTGRNEKAQNVDFPVLKNEITETLSTALFSSGGSREFVWAHQTYAEFLAARYLIERGLNLEQRLDFVLHPSDSEKRVVPQLRETAAWLASFDHHIFVFLMKHDPEVLLRSDVFAVDSQHRKMLVQALIEGYETESILPHRENHSDRYKLLKHPELVVQLEPILTNKALNWTTRDFALDVVTATGLSDLNPVLVAIILDLDEVHHLRVMAATALSKFGTDIEKQQLKAFLMVGHLNDPDDQIRGTLLEILWSDSMSVRELLICLTPQQKHNFIGTYQRFLSQDFLKESLPVADVYEFLVWFSDQKNWNWFGERYSFISVQNDFDNFLCQVLAHLDYPGMLSQLAQFLVHIGMEHGRYTYQNHKDSAFVRTIHENESMRQTILKEIVQKYLTDENRLYAVIFPYSDLQLAFSDDMPWFLQQLELESDLGIQGRWAALIQHRCNWSDLTQLQLIHDVYERNAVLKAKLLTRFGPIKLDSELANTLKADHQRMVELNNLQNNRKPRAIDPPVHTRIQNRLEQSKEDPKNWWRLIYWLSCNPDGQSFDQYSDIAKMYGWLNASPNIQKEIVETALEYIRFGDSLSHTWIGTGKRSFCDLAAFQALSLVYTEARGQLVFSDDIWAKWSAIIVVSISQDRADCFKYLLLTAYQKAPQAVIDASLAIAKQNSENEESIYLLHRLELIWDERLSEIFFGFLTSKKQPLQTFFSILECLVKQNYAPATQIALKHFKGYKTKRDYALAAGQILLQSIPGFFWSEIWAVLEKDAALGKEVLLHARGINIGDTHFQEKNLQDLYCYLEKIFPRVEDPDHSDKIEMHEVTARDEITELRGKILTALRERATPDAVQALEQIVQTFPEQNFIKWTIQDAREKLRSVTWEALSAEQILEITHQPNGRFVRSLSQLLEILMSSLERLRQQMHSETPTVNLLWNEWGTRKSKKFRPKDEATLSDLIKLFLESDLRGTGIILNREVEIRRSHSTFRGERTDILIDVSLDNPEREKVGIVIEVKGCWNKEIRTALKDQLVDRYLLENPKRYGIYLVGWFLCDQWDSTHDQKTATKALQTDLEGLRTELAVQAENESNSRTRVKAFVLDARGN
jgi:hypothetical protein